MNKKKKLCLIKQFEYWMNEDNLGNVNFNIPYNELIREYNYFGHTYIFNWKNMEISCKDWVMPNGYPVRLKLIFNKKLRPSIIDYEVPPNNIWKNMVVPPEVHLSLRGLFFAMDNDLCESIDTFLTCLETQRIIESKKCFNLIEDSYYNHYF